MSRDNPCEAVTIVKEQDLTPISVQLSLGHTKLESPVRYLGIKVDDALVIAEQTEV